MPSRNDPTRSRLIAGAMSGTSADGVDVAIVKIDGRFPLPSVKLLRHHHQPYPAVLRQQIHAIRQQGSASLPEMAAATRAISLACAEAVRTARHGQMIDAIAAHGQTMFHQPPDTMQWLDPALVAAHARCDVISDFRRADCAAGGQGAPLVPFADHVLFHHPTRRRVLLNIGGIANLTVLPAGGSIDALIAFDTGPGNCISDHLHPPFDPHGNIAAGGTALANVLERSLRDDYFHRPPPKSTDGPAMIAAFDDDPSASIADRLFTACVLTARTIADAISTFGGASVDEVIVSGGGTENRTMMRLLRERLGAIPLRTTDELGVPSQAKEAIAFALLGAATLDGVPGNVPSCTGASRPAVLGSITPNPFGTRP